MSLENTTYVITKLLNGLKLKVSTHQISKELYQHPDSSSFLAINDVLNNFNIQNKASIVDINTIQMFSAPFIAQIRTDQDEFVVISKISEDSLWISNERIETAKLPIAEFEPLFTGYILVTDDKFSKPYKKDDKISNRSIVKLSLILLFLASAIALYNSGYLKNNIIIILLLLKIFGIATAALLIMQSYKLTNPYLKKLCTGNKVDCHSVLKSRASQITSFLSWSEVGLLYFSSSFLITAFLGNLPYIVYIKIINICALPFTFYSIYSQWRIIKKWCTFCLIIQALLWCEFLIMLGIPIDLRFSITSHYLSILIFCLASPIFLWYLFKDHISIQLNLKDKENQLRGLKFNHHVFEKLSQMHDAVKLLDENSSIILGDSSACNTISIVSNPYCNPCAEAHKVIEKWYTDRANFRLQIIFAGGEDAKDKVASHLYSLYQLKNEKILQEAISGWFHQLNKNFTDWSARYPIEITVESSSAINEQKQWCEKNNILGTPTILLNGYFVPPNWQVEDLKYMV